MVRAQVGNGDRVVMLASALDVSVATRAVKAGSAGWVCGRQTWSCDVSSGNVPMPRAEGTSSVAGAAFGSDDAGIGSVVVPMRLLRWRVLFRVGTVREHELDGIDDGSR